jgi:hypothetical protein
MSSAMKPTTQKVRSTDEACMMPVFKRQGARTSAEESGALVRKVPLRLGTERAPAKQSVNQKSSRKKKSCIGALEKNKGFRIPRLDNCIRVMSTSHVAELS